MKKTADATAEISKLRLKLERLHQSTPHHRKLNGERLLAEVCSQCPKAWPCYDLKMELHALTHREAYPRLVEGAVALDSVVGDDSP